MSEDRLQLTPVELAALASSPYEARYAPDEKITALVVDNFPALGKLAAMWFIERVQANPGGVVSLPTVPEDQDLSRTRVVPGAPESPHPGDARTGVPERAQPGRVLSAQQRDAACRGKQVNTRSVLLQC